MTSLFVVVLALRLAQVISSGRLCLTRSHLAEARGRKSGSGLRPEPMVLAVERGVARDERGAPLPPIGYLLGFLTRDIEG